MGLDIRTAEFLLHSKTLGVDFTSTATLGHQRLMLSGAEHRLMKGWLPALDLRNEQFADPFLKALGAVTPVSVDASKYEGAEVIHNLNDELPAALHSRFTCLVDGGTLEHVFDIKQSLKSCMQMVRPDGHLVLCQMANNCMGHGFYQFSPEFFYSVLTPANGFAVKAIALNVSGKWYEPLDPAKIGERIQAQTSDETFIYVLAQRVADIEPFKEAPHQSDYVSNLTSNGTDANAVQRASMSRLRRFRRQLGEIKRDYIYRCIPWLETLEDDFKRRRKLRHDRLSNARRFRQIGKRLLGLTTMGWLPVQPSIEFCDMCAAIAMT